MKQKKIAPILVQQELTRRKVKIFSSREFSRIFGVSPTRTKYFLESQTKREFLCRLKRDLYALKTAMPGEEEISNALYRPSYISFEYALGKYNILPEMAYGITAATTKPTRIFTLEKKPFFFFKMKKEAFSGYSLVKEEEKKYLLADPEKALVDYLYFVTIGRKTKNERLRTKNLSRKKIIRYAKLYGRKSLLDLVKSL